ncbi:hypothetical protein J5N97_017995 [Dioscorea zingiberensis]|uniref:AAA+ ATPase domain-containing protein n=1 Tax=Dioscorea zingiberensis TaxID=325984 RepID=A0A9D5CQ14_9LILI|nr:hypothetical protein J5N97_017995 [Dioscorea zingiberensis]
MDESGEDAMAMGAVNPSPPAEVNRQRRSIQTKLPWAVRPRGGGDGDESDGENKGKRQRKRESLPRVTKKSLAACNEASKLKKGDKRSCVLKKFPEGSPQKMQKQEQDAVALKVRSSKRCKATKSKYKGLNDNQITNAAFKDPSSSGPEWKESSMGTPTTGEFNDILNLDNQSQLVQQSGSNLQLDGKIAVEASTELSTGKRIHQFFACWEETKRATKSLDASNRKSNFRSAHDMDDLLGSPIHIYDKVEDEFVGLHWQNWVFTNETPDSGCYCPPKSSASIFEGSVKPLELDTGYHPKMYLDKILAKTNFTMMMSASSSLWEGQNQNEKLCQLDNGSSSSSMYLPSKYSNCLIDVDTKKDHMLIKERLDSYNLRHGYFPASSLWTDKYQPENTLEVCGNINSTRIISEWLKSWHEGPRSNRSSNSTIKDGHDSSSEIESDMDDTDDEATRKNVLLLTGPIGSGKSAAIRACAKEQGFKVIEVNTSDIRNGALMKQKFGDSMETSVFTPSLCSFDDPVGGTKKIIPSLSSDIIDIDNVCDSSSQCTPENCQQSETATGSYSKVLEGKNTTCRKVSGSIQVFEDVDVVFYEDLGFISAVLQLAEKTKKPIILTSNNRNPILPHYLDRLLVDFTIPSYEELLSHIQMVCAVEGVHVSSKLLERLINYCQGDIRKTLMLLQFWCQGTRCQIDDSKRCTYSPLPFDIGTAHLIMPRVIPWDFPCSLSEKIEEEISGSLSIFEENFCVEDVKEHMLCTTEMANSSKIVNKKTNRNRNSKKGRLKRNCSSLDCTEFSADANGLEDFSDASYSPAEFAQQRVKRRSCIVLSSQSDDELSTDVILPTEVMSVPHNSLLLHDMTMPPIFYVKDVPNEVEPPSKSSFASLDDISNEVDSLTLPVNIRQVSVNLSDYASLGPVQSRADIDCVNNLISESNNYSKDKIVFNCEIDPESVCGHEEPQASGCEIMDESSRIGSNMLACVKYSNPVKQKWQKLKSCREDLRSCLNSNQKDASTIMNLSYQLTDLISQTDVMIRGCEALFSDILDEGLMPSVESEDFSWVDRQFEMGSTYAQHGFCFYTNKCATIGSIFGSQNTVDLAQEMLASSTNVMALGKLLSTRNLPSEGILQIEAMKFGSMGRKVESGLSNAILPIIPARASMSLKGTAFHEYASFMSQISKSEDSRLSKIKNETQGRRSRASLHYFNSGQFTLTSEDVNLLAQSFCFKERVH